MIRLYVVCALSMVMAVAGGVVCAQPSEWLWGFQSGADFQNSSTPGLFSADSDAQDGYDAQDAMIEPGPKVYFGTYHQAGVSGWTGPSGFYSYDFRSVLPQEVGASHTWVFYVWGDPALNAGAYRMVVAWYRLQPRFVPPPGLDFRVALRSKPQDIVGGPEVGTTWSLSVTPNGGVALPVYRSTDGLTGYMFEFTATVIPEPSCLAVLLAALGGFGVMLRRR